MRNDLDAHVDRLASRQHGVWTWRQLERLGATRSYASRRVLKGVWQAPHPLVYAHRNWARTLEGEALAAAWSLKDGLTSGGTAAQLQRVPGAGPCPLEVTVGRKGSRPRSFVVHESSWLPDAHRSAVGVVPCTSLPRTLVDLAKVWPDDRLLDAWDQSIDRKRTSLDAIERAAVPFIGRGHGHADRLRRLLELHDPGEPPPQSLLERVLHDLVEEGGYGPSTAQMPLAALCDLSGRVDRYLPHVALVLDFERDLQRNNHVQAEGHHVARFTYRQLVHDRSEVFEVLDRHFTRNGFRRDASGLWIADAA
jgi:hypothetical protein